MTEEAESRLQRPSNEEQAESVRNPANTITGSLLKHVPGIVESCGATALFVYVDAMDQEALDLDLAVNAKVFCVTKAAPEEKESRVGALQCLRIPNVPMTRLGQVKIAVFLALSRGLIKHGDRVVFVSGLAAAQTLDTIIVTEVGRESEIFASSADLTTTSSKFLPEVIERIVDIASELGSEGREGRAVGAMFVIGDTDRVLPLTRQLVLNPFKGYPPQERNILDCSLEETVKELATLDGAFIVRGDGVMETCGTYIRTTSQPDFELPRGPWRPASRRCGHHRRDRLHCRDRQRIHRLDHHLSRRTDCHRNPETPQHGGRIQAVPLSPEQASSAGLLRLASPSHLAPFYWHKSSHNQHLCQSYACGIRKKCEKWHNK